MEALLLVIIILLVGLAAGGFYFFQQLQKGKGRPTFDSEEAMIKADSKASARLLEAEKEALEMRAKAQQEVQRLLKEVEGRERELVERERKLIDRSKTVDQRFDELENQEKSVEQAKRDVKAMRAKIATELESIAQLTREEAEKALKTEVERDLSSWAAKQVREMEAQVKRESEEKARNILIEVMQNSATDYVAESSTTTFEISDEALKGKIIGREGRNIRAFERLTGTDIIVDEAPNQITISCFDPIRREVATIALQKMLKDGRIHPAAIEETVKNVKKDLAREVRRNGEKIAYEAGFSDLPEDIILLLGRYKYRFSYGQNLAKHSLEMVNIAGQLAAEMKADVRLSKLACLLHDIGKVMTHEYEGKPHHHISGDIVRKYLKDEKLVNAVESHHGDIEAKSIEAEIVKIADAISGARPGARRDTYDEYVKRVSALEQIAKQYPSVEEAFAVQAGREVRVVVRPDSSTDEDVKVLAHKIAKEIEQTQTYAGVVKVTVIRELRVVEEAK